MLGTMIKLMPRYITKVNGMYSEMATFDLADPKSLDAMVKFLRANSHMTISVAFQWCVLFISLSIFASVLCVIAFNVWKSYGQFPW